jgi:predicted permease
MQAARTDPSDALKSGGRTQTAGRSKLRFALTAAQLALSMALLVAASSFVQSLRRLRSLDLGLDTERTIVVAPTYEDRRTAPKDEVVTAGLNDIAARVRRLPGVEEVAFSVMRPFDGTWGIFGYFSGQDSLQSVKNPDDWAAGFIVSSNYFTATGMPFVRGGTFDPNAAPGARGIVVNETMARLLWPAGNALGQCVRLEKRTAPCSLVTGVVRDARRAKVVEPSKPQYFLSIDDWAPRGWTASTLVLRVSPESRAQIVPALRSPLLTAFPSSTPLVESLDETIAPQLRPWRLGADLFTIVGIIALVVTIVGVYASIAYHVSQRSREFGVRIAFGATTRDVVRTVLRVGMQPVCLGIALGVGLAVATGRLIATLLYDVSPYAITTLSMIAILLAVVSMIAMLVPALRASRIDPLNALRE